MSEKLPAVTGRSLIRFLEVLGYEVVRQRGSHVRLMKNTASGKHKITIPDHDPVAKGTLSDILGKVSLWCQIPKDELLRHLRNK
jgi:predicted RNA binding protein YcfA (HicA-like mRNA interferase family)